jgi:UDP-4-amino-4,6-dideoxy-N-acetyl-beta-L-altrosamine N-acetyltransferase
MINGKICNLKKINLNHAREIFKWRKSRNVQKYFPSKIDNNFQKHLKWIKKYIKSKFNHYFIIETKSKNNIGLCYLIDIDKTNNKAEFGFYLAEKKFYGLGYAIEAEFLILEYGFQKLRLNKIYCESLEINSRVFNIHKKFGFKIDGIKREDILKNGKYLNIILMSVLKKNSKKYLDNVKKLIKLYIR